MKECSIVLLMRTCRNLKKTNVSQKRVLTQVVGELELQDLMA
jgi:hypothetical protein